MRRWLPVLLVLTACSFDQDAEFLPEWQATWWVVADSNANLHWYRIDSATVVEMPSGDVPGSIDWRAEELWTVNADNSISRRNPFTGDPELTWQAPSGNLVHIAGGLDYLYVTSSDSLLYLVGRKKGDWHEVKLQGKGGLVETRSDRGFVVVNDTIILKIQEQALTARDTFQFSTPVVSLQNDPGHFTWVSHRDEETLKLTRLNYHTELFNSVERPQQVDQILFTPFNREIFGAEYLEDLFVQEGCLAAPSSICGSAFWPLWELSEILVIREDSLFRYSLNDGALLHSYGPFEGGMIDGVNVVR